MADFKRGIKAGVITGAIYTAVALVLVFTLDVPQLWEATGLAFSVPGTQIIRGLVFGAAFAGLYAILPGATAIVKGVVLSLLFWVLTVVELVYTNMGWPWQIEGVLPYGTLYGGTLSPLNLSSVSLALIGIMSALLFGVLTGVFWNRFGAKESAGGGKARPVLLISFILGAVFWVVLGGIQISYLATVGFSLAHVLFFPSWTAIFPSLVLFVGLIGWLFVLGAWRKARRGESGFEWGLAGGVLMVITGFMMLPGTLAITGAVVRRREFVTSEAMAGDKTRANIRRNPALLIISAIMLAVIVTVGLTMPTMTETYTSVTYEQYSSTAISRHGLSLTISLDSATYRPGEPIIVNIQEKNILPRENNVPAADLWAVEGLTVSPYGRLYFPFGISVLEGCYDSGNFSRAAPIQIFDPNVPDLVPDSRIGGSYNFQPWSTAVHISLDWSRNMTVQVTFDGFWTGSQSNATFSNFTPGMYTVVGGDQWGTLVVLHFTIMGPGD